MFSRKLVSITISGLAPIMLAAWVLAGTYASHTSIVTTSWGSQVGNPQEPFTPGERARLSEQALAHLRTDPVVRNQRMRVLTVKRLTPEKEAPETSTAGVVVFNYSQGNAKRIIINPANGAILRVETLRGRPQASEEELQEASQIIRADQEHARLLDAGGVLEGGFVVDDPGRRSPRHRFIQFQILTPDRQSLQRFVTVNLNTGRIAESRRQ